MLLVAGFAVSLIVGVLLARYAWDYDAAAIPLVVIGGVGLVACAVIAPASRYEDRQNIIAIESLRQTIASSRGVDGIEGAAFRLKIAETNQWLARRKAANGTVFDIFIDDSVMSVEPVQ